jgi:hypothetical protein
LREAQAKSFLVPGVEDEWKKKREREIEIARQKLKDSKNGRGLEMKNVYGSGSRKSFLLLL